MPTKDIALFNRLVFLSFTRSEFSDEEKRHYDELKAIEKRGLTHLTGEILKLRNAFVRNFRSSWEEAVDALNDRLRNWSVEDRTLRNWATLLAAFRAAGPGLDLPFTWEELLDIMTRMCGDQHRKTRQNGELSGFWEILEALVSGAKAWPEAVIGMLCVLYRNRQINITFNRTATAIRRDPADMDEYNRWIAGTGIRLRSRKK